MSPPPKGSAARANKAVKRRATSKPELPTGPGGKPEVRIFVSYSHVDAAARDKLHTHLAPWRRDDVSVWYDENIDPGAELDPAIARELRRAHIFVALFSPAYLASRYCWDIEYKRAMGRRSRKLMRVVAVVVKPCSWKQTPAAGFKLLPKDGREPERWTSADAAYVDVAEGIGRVIKAIRAELTATVKRRARPKTTPPPALAAKKLKPTAKPRRSMAKSATRPKP